MNGTRSENETLDSCGVCSGGLTYHEPNADQDDCGICDGDGTSCLGCTDDRACNYNPNATIDDESCILRTTYYLDADNDGLGCSSTAVDLCPNNPILDTNLYVTDAGGTEFDDNC